MKYFFIIERENGEQEHGAIVAANTAAAHLEMMDKSHGEKYRLFPANKALLSLSIATATAKNAVMRQGTETQFTIDRECRQLSAMTAAAMLARPDMRGADVTAYIMERLPLFGHDMQDFFGYAMQGVQAAAARGYDVRAAAACGYKALNRYIHGLNTASARELSTEYITSGGGDIVAYSSAIACIIHGGEKWTAAGGGDITPEQAAALGAAIAAAAAVLSPTQRHIMELLGRGYSMRQIATKTGRAVSTVAQNTAIIRAKLAEHITANAPQFADMIHGAAAVDTAAAQAAAAKKAARDKETQAARAKAYRERKKAAAQAAAN